MKHDFQSITDQDLDGLGAAPLIGLKGAVEIGWDHTLAGNRLFGAEVIVSDGDRRERSILSIGTPPLQ